MDKSMLTVSFLRLLLQTWTSSAGCCWMLQGQMLDNVRKALMACRLSFGLASFKEPGWGGGTTNGTLSAGKVNRCALLQCFQTAKYRKRCSAAPLLAKQIQNTYALEGIKIAPNAQHPTSSSSAPWMPCRPSVAGILLMMISWFLRVDFNQRKRGNNKVL